MSIVDLQSTPAPSSIDYDRFRLRAFLESLDATELDVRSDPIDLADVASVFEGNPRAAWLRRVGPEGAELVGNVVASRSRLAHALGTTTDRLRIEVLRRLAGTGDVVEVAREEAPVQQVVLTGADADLTELPVHLQHGLDPAPYISASVDFTIDPKNGWTSVGMRRLMLRGRQEAGIDMVAPSDLRVLYLETAARGERLPVSFAVGSHPIDQIASQMRIPGDELVLMSKLRGAPLPVVRCVTNDIRVPADAEYILEGYLDPRGHVEAEGPFGEFLGYYGALKHNPVFHLTAITHRRDAVFQTTTIGGRGMAQTDTAALAVLPSEVAVWRSLEMAVREPVAVCASPASGGVFNVRIALRQRVPGEARNAIAAVFGSMSNVKNVFVVDPDIDVFSDQQIDWALATRFQADRDLVIQSGLRTIPLDPSLEPGVLTGAKLGFDLTWPFGGVDNLERTIPEPPSYDYPRYDSVKAAIEDGPKYFAELMAAVGSRDGRDVIREIEALRAAGGLDRDGNGRYYFTA